MTSTTIPAPIISSSTTLWATASKEWVIQPKPKPGRKPKKDTVPTIKDEFESKGRRVQNRAAQRAFRERKQSQLAELQARVLSYEQGEIERNVALQSIAKRLKEENEKLRAENNLLKEKVSRLEQERVSAADHEKKRWRDDSPSNVSPTCSTRKRSRTTTESPMVMTAPPFAASHIPSPPSMVSSPDSNGTSETRFSPLPLDSHGGDPNLNSTPSLSGLLDFPPNTKPTATFEAGLFPTFDCGFCNEDTPCVCREIAMQQAATERLNLKLEALEQTTVVASMDRSIRLESPPASQSSILDNLPAYQPPVPLRRRAGALTNNVVFPVVSAPQPPQIALPSCSGDPNNCLACAGDPFGKAFCAEVEKTVSAMPPCVDCPCNQSTSNPGAANCCCGDPAKCNHRSAFPDLGSTFSNGLSTPANAETIPTNDAWQRFKAHPNVEFSDLAMLAEVVARRSKCSGPRVVISPAPGSVTPERDASPQSITGNTTDSEQDHQPVLLTDPHAHYRERERQRSKGPSSPHSVQNVPLQCGRQRICEVSAEAVEQGIRLLDAKYSHSRR